MRLFAAMTLLLALSCTYDYGKLRGSSGPRDGAANPGAPDVLDAASELPANPERDASVDSPHDAGPAMLDGPRGADVPTERPGVVMADAVSDGEPSTGGTGGTGATETGGSGGSSSSDTGATGGSIGSGTGGIAGSGGEGGTGGVTGLGGSSSFPSETGGQGGSATTGGVGGTSMDGGVDSPAVDAAEDGADGAVDGVDGAMDGGEGDLADATLAVNSLTATPTGTESESASAQNQMKLNYYAVDTSVTLVQIEQYLTPSTVGDPLHWVVYRSGTQTGTDS